MQGISDNEDDGSISRITEDKSDNVALENNDLGTNRNQTYPPRYRNNDDRDCDRIHRAESDFDSRDASFNSKFIRKFGAGTDGTRQNLKRTFGNNHRRKNDDYSHDSSGNHRTNK